MSGLHKDYNAAVEIVLGTRSENVLKRFFLANYINGNANSNAYKEEIPMSAWKTAFPLRAGEKLFWDNVYNSFNLNRSNYFSFCNYILQELKTHGVTNWEDSTNERVVKAIMLEIDFWKCANPDQAQEIKHGDHIQRLIKEPEYAYTAAVLLCDGSLGISNTSTMFDDDNTISSRLNCGFRNRQTLLDVLTIPLHDVQDRHGMSLCARMFTRYQDEHYVYYDHLRNNLRDNINHQIVREIYNGPIRRALFVEWTEGNVDTERMVAFKQLLFYAGVDEQLERYLNKVIDENKRHDDQPAQMVFLPYAKASHAFGVTLNDVQVFQQLEKEVKQSKAYAQVVGEGYVEATEQYARYEAREIKEFGARQNFKTSGVSGFS